MITVTLIVCLSVFASSVSAIVPGAIVSDHTERPIQVNAELFATVEEVLEVEESDLIPVTQVGQQNLNHNREKRQSGSRVRCREYEPAVYTSGYCEAVCTVINYDYFVHYGSLNTCVCCYVY